MDFRKRRRSCPRPQRRESLKDAALRAAGIADWGIDYEAVLTMTKPEELSRKQWEGVQERAGFIRGMKDF